MTEVEYLVPDWPAPERVVALCTTRVGGYSTQGFAELNLAEHVGDDPQRVAANREVLTAALGGGIRFQWLEQVHGTGVVQARPDGVVRRGDAAVTAEAGLACCVLTADCLPVFFASRQGDAVAVAHAGWRGLAAGVLEHTLAGFPAAARDTLVWLGPAIGPCHFEVGAEVLAAFLESSDERDANAVSNCFIATDNGKYLANLYRLASIRLARSGVVSVTGGTFCTYCDSSRFYSYRRHQTTGRMASLIYLKP